VFRSDARASRHKHVIKISYKLVLATRERKREVDGEGGGKRERERDLHELLQSSRGGITRMWKKLHETR
jgi:hypothetical protein